MSTPMPNINPQVITGTGTPDPMGPFLQMLMQGMQQGQQGYQFQQQLRLQKQQEERLQREADMKRDAAAAEGEALRTLLMAISGGLPSTPTPTEAGGQRTAQNPQMIRTVGTQEPALPIGGQPGGGPQPFTQLGPLQTLAGAAQGVPASAVPSLVQNAGPLLRLQADMQSKAEELRNIETAVNAIPDESKRAGARSLLTFATMGANLPTDVQQSLFPNLFPEGKAVDPASMNAASTLFKTGAFTWGQARRQAGVPQIEGIPDDVRYTRPTLGLGRPQDQQARASAQLGVMQSAAPIIDSYSQQAAPGPLTSWLARGGGKGLKGVLANAALSDNDRQFLQASRQFVDAWVRTVSGAQTNEQEYERFIVSVTESFGDDADTRRQKRQMRQVMLQSVQDIAGGHKTRVQSLESSLRLDWSPAQKTLLEDALKRARRYEADIAAGKAIDPLELSRDVIQSTDELSQRMGDIERALEFMFQGRDQ